MHAHTHAQAQTHVQARAHERMHRHETKMESAGRAAGVRAGLTLTWHMYVCVPAAMHGRVLQQVIEEGTGLGTE